MAMVLVVLAYMVMIILPAEQGLRLKISCFLF